MNISPEVNDELGVHELVAYDPMLPQSLFAAWKAAAGTSAVGKGAFAPKTIFCPAITSARLARLFGVGLVVTPHGSPGPSGSVFDGTLGNIDLYRIPGAAVATTSALGPDGSFPASTASETPAKAVQPYPGAWRVTTDAATPQALRLRVTDVPGWHATLDGRPFPCIPSLEPCSRPECPPATHTVVLTYWPTTFTLGLLLAGLSVSGLALALALESRRHRRSTPSPVSEALAT